MVRAGTIEPQPCLNRVIRANGLAADNGFMQGRRKSLRNLCTDLLKIRWKDADGAVHREYATLEDISEGGLSIRMDSAVAPGSLLTVHYPKGKYEGCVKYCQSEGNDHVLGIEFLPGYRWSRHEYKPPHLLQFRLWLVEPPPRPIAARNAARRKTRSRRRLRRVKC